MDFEVNKVYHGFKLLEEKNLKDINSTARLFMHEKSGARLLSLLNDDDNKVFSVSFRTPPESSNGLSHILEHSVLCGSRKFPTKEPFVDLLKGSLNTFLNAMTFSDKTMYPLASKNEKDFYNLMDVYLDAVFYPKIYSTPEILMQEGWHYELNGKDDDVTYKGVVYNEMKGALSSPESILMRKVQESLYPDTPYFFESGGDPDVIPELTQEKFIAYHKKYYHPSNSYLFLYGNGDLDTELGFIDDNYLKDFDRNDVESSIPLQKAYDKVKEVKYYYPIGEDESEEQKAYLSMNFSAGKSTDNEMYIGMEILSDILLGTQASPLKKALIDAEIGKDVFGLYDNSIQQPTFSIIVKNSNENMKEKFKKVVYDTLNELLQNGIDKKLIEASINANEFRLREADYQGLPKGLVYGIKCMDSWLYDSDPFMHLEYEDTLGKIKSALTTDYFEKLIDKYLLKNTHASIIVLCPQKGLSESRAEEVKQNLNEFKSNLTDEQIQDIIDSTKRLKVRQQTPDSKEDIEKIPLLKLSDINKEAEKIPEEIKTSSGVKVLLHPMFTNGIAYVDLLFDTSCVKQEDLLYAVLLSDVLGKVDTTTRNYMDISNEIYINTGDTKFSFDVYDEKGNSDNFASKLTARSKALTEKIPNMMELIEDIISNSKFDNKKRIKEIIQQSKSQYEMKVYDRGHSVAAKRLISHFSKSGRYAEYATGLNYYKFLSNLEKNIDSMFDEISEKLVSVSKVIFNKNNLMAGVTMSGDEYEKFEKPFEGLAQKLPDETLEKQVLNLKLDKINEGLLTPGKVQYVAKGYNFIKEGYSYAGTMKLLSTIASTDYLWNKVRVQGGAYGCFANFDRNGNVFFVSYRDPNLSETIDTYDSISKYLEKFNVNEREMTKYIIGTISQLDFPLTPSMKGERAIANYLAKVTYEDIQKDREQILSAKPDDIRGFADLLDSVMKSGCVCVLGNEEKIKENKNIFTTLTKVFD